MGHNGNQRWQGQKVVRVLHAIRFLASVVVRGGGERVALYMVVHTWKKENFKTVGRKVVEVLPRLPKGTAIVSSLTDARQTGAWCVYETEEPTQLKALLDKNVPEMTSEILPVMQFFPPGPDVYKIMHILSS